MTSASLMLRDVGFSSARLHADRQTAASRLSERDRREFDRMLLDVIVGEENPRFTTFGMRSALRHFGHLCQSPMRSIARCADCDLRPDHCQCAEDGDGRLYCYTCTVCGSVCDSGEDCCEEESEDDDGYYRASWSGIRRRDLEHQGFGTLWAPYYLGIEYETDSTPSRDDWTNLAESPRILGAWGDATVRGPEIVTQPVRGQALAEAIELLASLDVSLASGNDPVGQQCGLHMHVDAREMTRAAKRAFARLWATVSRALHSDPDMHLRSRGGYAVPLSHSEVRSVIDAISADEDSEDWPVRYRDCNFAALPEHGTIEIRLWGWPSSANNWSPRARARHMWRCVRWTQALRVAARLIGQSGLEERHPVLSLPAHDALALVETLVPLHPSAEV